MMRRMALFGVTNLAVGVLATAALAAPACAQINLNEFLAAPGSDWDGNGAFSSRDDEWVEIVNGNSAPVTLDGLYLRDGAHLMRYGFTGTLDAHATLVVYGSQAYAWEAANGFAKDGLSLNNSGDTVELVLVSGPDTLIADSRSYGSKEGASERSTGRLPDGSSTWVLFDALDPYTGGGEPPATGCMPTPGRSNSTCSTPVEPTTWGAIKRLFGEAAAR